MNSGQALVNALLFGKLDGLQEEEIFLFARTGLSHLFSASGFHLFAAQLVAHSLVSPILPFLSTLRMRESAHFLSRILLMTFFGEVTGWSSPMVRAFVFSALTSGARLLEVKADRAWIFLLSLVCSSVLGKSGTLSFLLSAFGMAGVLYIQPRRAWAISLGPWLFTLPLTIWCFGLFPPLAPVWNLTFGLAISWLVLPPAILVLLGKSIGLPTSTLENFTTSLMKALTSMLERAANAAGGAFWVNPTAFALSACGLLAAHWLWRKRQSKTAVILACSTFFLKWWPIPAIAVLDVGQGDAVLLQTENRLLLSDFGPPGKSGGTAQVCQSLEALGIGELDDLLLSHSDLDHRGGLSCLLARHSVNGALWFREAELLAPRIEQVLVSAERAKVPIRFLGEKDAPSGVRCWLPPFEKGNDASPLCRAQTVGAGEILLTGDMSQKAESWFLEALRPFPQARWLKVAHHGSQTSSSTPFLVVSGAEEALVSVGARNRYHHPSEQTLDRIRNAGLNIRRTDQEGTLKVFSWRNWHKIPLIRKLISATFPASSSKRRSYG